MCTNYENDAAPTAIADRFGLKDIPGALPETNLRPTDPGLVIKPGNQARVLTWGFKVDWSKRPIVNARAEILNSKPIFMPLLENRCLVPASAYFEWRRQGKAHLKNRITLAEDALMAFAGLFWDDRFTIITCAPTPSVAHIHNRMPVILQRQAETAWIDPTARFDEVAPLLSPYSESPLRVLGEQPPPDLFS